MYGELGRLKQRWLASRHPADGAAYLRARVTAGELHPSRLQLAAHLGDAAACLAARNEAPSPELRSWLEELEPFADGFLEWVDLYGQATLAAFELVEWPLPSEAALAEQALPVLRAFLQEGGSLDGPLWDEAEALWLAANALEEEHPLACAIEGVVPGLGSGQQLGQDARDAILGLAQLAGAERIRAAVCERLLPWALEGGPGIEPELERSFSDAELGIDWLDEAEASTEPTGAGTLAAGGGNHDHLFLGWLLT